MASNPYQPPRLDSFDEQPPAADLPLEDGVFTPQQRVDALLTNGVLFSVMWVLGVGSAFSLYLARRAHRTIVASDQRLSGIFWVWWCYVVGLLGVFMGMGLLLLMLALSTPVQRLLSG
ncbi:MAG: hypothetical protein RIC55_30575 [Pirellulaceae bacterium]